MVPNVSSYDVGTFLPTIADLEQLIKNFSTLVRCMLTMYIPGFETFKSLCISHIKHS